MTDADIKFGQRSDIYLGLDPQPIRPFNDRDRIRPGQTFGRFTAIGKYRPPLGRPYRYLKGMWVVQCSCGLFTVRRETKLVRGSSCMCPVCQHAAGKAFEAEVENERAWRSLEREGLTRDRA